MAAGLKGGVVAALRLPGSDPEAWNTILIGGQRAPGKVEVRSKVERKIDAKESPGSDSFALTDKGAACAEIEIDFLFWAEEQAAAFGPIYAQHLDPRRKLAKRNVTTVVHPALYFSGIKQLFFYGATAPVPVGNVGQQARVCCKGREFNPKTQIGGGSTKPKPAPSYAGQGGKWTTTALGSAPATYGPPTQAEAAAQAAAAKAATAAPAPARTLAEQQARAAKGDPQAAQVVATVRRVQP